MLFITGLDKGVESCLQTFQEKEEERSHGPCEALQQFERWEYFKMIIQLEIEHYHVIQKV